ncbi:MAG: C4-dicarboxylate transporter [Proteobacteria bacterium]|nr:C4-dicarboxylate transporter [Pseudomonadota bacterium]
MKALLVLSRAIDALNERVGRVVLWLVLATSRPAIRSNTTAMCASTFSTAACRNAGARGSIFSARWCCEMSPDAGGLLRWPVRLMIPLGFALLTLQGISEIIKRIAFLRGQITLTLEHPIEKV